MKQLLGIDFLSRFDIINHVATDMDSLTFLGKNSFGSSIYLNSVYLNAKIKIITGYVEPHFFGGFSGAVIDESLSSPADMPAGNNVNPNIRGKSIIPAVNTGRLMTISFNRM